ncbi:hypothetical protein M3Y97_00087100 [Aphelenchoides bicaudatus]|nr:hypothetical protein M3Y97_00087100 [Aphelenchoides bicaudatus]
MELDPINIGYNRYFHYSIGGLEAEGLLQPEPNGTFLIRESTSFPGEFALSVKNNGTVLHVRIYSDDTRIDDKFYILPTEYFPTLVRLLAHYAKRPMIQHCGTAVKLLRTLSTTRFDAASIDQRIDCLTTMYKKVGKFRDGIAEEYEKLHASKGIQLFLSCKEGRRDENIPKESVKLDIDCTAGEDLNDYINASTVEVLVEGPVYEEFKYLNFKRYISTQGCTPATVDSFWHMVWQLNSRVIVMTTKELEKGRLKCCKYWPDLNGEEHIYGTKREFKIRTIKEYNPRRFVDDPNDVPVVRRLYQYQFLGWEDQTSPSGQLLRFMDEINLCVERKSLPDTGPVIVHCSAGIGRTGTYIVLDIILAKIKQQGPDCAVDIFKTVKMVREQRANMVQTETQYRFIYEAISKYMRTHYRSAVLKPRSSSNGHERREERFLDADDED